MCAWKFELIHDSVLDTYDEEIVVTYNALSQLPSLGTAILQPDTWFHDAFQSLPLGLAVFDGFEWRGDGGQ